jgi:glycosyltransferase involved in cell wall biosynthesis
MGVSVLIPTLDEQRNLADCLASVAWSDDVVVVDSGSRDGTAEIARRAGARVVDFRWDGHWPKKKGWALANVGWRHPWLLLLDADERVPPGLAAELQSAAAADEHAGFLIDRRFHFMGRWIRHCGYSPSWNLRLVLWADAHFEQLVDGDTGSGDNEVHEHLLVGGSVGRLRGALDHYAWPDVATFVEKHNRYSSWEAAVEVRGGAGGELAGPLARRRRLRRLARRMPFRPTARFLYSFVLRAGFLDGYPGYALCRLLAGYELQSVLKARELRRRGGARR